MAGPAPERPASEKATSRPSTTSTAKLQAEDADEAAELKRNIYNRRTALYTLEEEYAEFAGKWAAVIQERREALYTLEKRYAELAGNAAAVNVPAPTPPSADASSVEYPLRMILFPDCPAADQVIAEPGAVPTPLWTRETQASRRYDSPADLTLSIPDKRFTVFHKSYREKYSVGMIGWFPILRPSLSPCVVDMQTEFGFVCGKVYPVIIVDKLDDCMIGLIITTAGGDGLTYKRDSVRSRSVYVVKEEDNASRHRFLGHNLNPREPLRVRPWDAKNGWPTYGRPYNPATGAFVDLLDTIKVPYDTRFIRAGDLTQQSTQDLVQLRAAAVLTSSKISWFGLGKKEGNSKKCQDEFKKWLDEWRAKFRL